MKKLILVPLVILASCCGMDPVDVDLSYLKADRQTYDTIAPSMEKMIESELLEPIAARPENPWTGLPLTDQDLMALQAVLDTWEFRLEGAEEVQ